MPKKSAHLQMATLITAVACSASAADLSLRITQLTHGPRHHFFGYIGQCQTTPWNASGRFILSLRTEFHHRPPGPSDAADVVLLNTADGNRVRRIDQTRAWNFQQGTMFYWSPTTPETQFFFNDRNPDNQQVFTVLHDIEKGQRIREYRFENVPVANSGVSPTGDFFLAINYGRLARLRPVTGYPGAADPTATQAAPADDGIFRVDIRTGKRSLVVSLLQLQQLVQNRHDPIEEIGLYINHTLINRTGEYVYFFTRGRLGDDPMAINVPCSVRIDGSELKTQQWIGGHPEWDEGTVVIGAHGGRQVLYEIKRQKIVDQIASADIITRPGGDIALSADANWLACGYATTGGKNNRYVVVRRSDNAFARSELFSRGPYTSGELRIDSAPCWNRNQSAILVPGVADDGTRQLYLMTVER